MSLMTCIFHFLGYPVSARLTCGYDSALQFQSNSIWNSSKVILKKLVIPLITLWCCLHFGLDPSLLPASLALWKQKKTVQLQQWGIQKQVNSSRRNNMSGKNSSGPLWKAHTTLDYTQGANQEKRRAWKDGQSHLHKEKWTQTTGK